jgi:hypothetical protein
MFLLVKPVTLISNASLVSSATTLALVLFIAVSFQLSSIKLPTNTVLLAALRLMTPRYIQPAAALSVSLYALNLISNVQVVSAGSVNLADEASRKRTWFAVLLVVSLRAINTVC